MLTGCLGGVVDYRSPHQKRAATHAYDRSGTAAFSWVSVGVRWPRHTVSRWGPRGGFPGIAHPSVVRCVCRASRIRKGAACLCRTVRGGVVDQGGKWQKKTTKCRPLRWGGGERTASTKHTTKVDFEAVIKHRFQTHRKALLHGDDLPHLKPLRSSPTHARHSTEENPGRKLRRHPTNRNHRTAFCGGNM